MRFEMQPAPTLYVLNIVRGSKKIVSMKYYLQ